MTAEPTDAAQLEGVLFRLMEYQSKENTDKVDTMIMVSLVNLLGIVNVMNKASLRGSPVSRNAFEDPMLMSLLQMLTQGQGQQGARGGPPGINPALLLSLLGSRGQGPENALLLALLSSLMQPPPVPPPQPAHERPEVRESPPCQKKVESGARETKNRSGHLSWDRRLG